MPHDGGTDLYTDVPGVGGRRLYVHWEAQNAASEVYAYRQRWFETASGRRWADGAVASGSSMRILFVNPYYKPYLGGIERIIERVGANLLGYPDVERVGVLTTRAFFPDRWMHELPDHEIVDGLEVFRCTFRPSVIPRVFHAALAGYVSFDVPRVLRQFRPHVIHFTYGEWWAANLMTFLASPRIPHVLSTIYHNVPHTRGTAPLYAVNRLLAPRMDAIHVLTEMEGAQVHQAYRAPLGRTVVIPPGIEPVGQLPDRSVRDVVTLLAVGRLNAHKGQLRLLTMLHQILQQCPDLPVRLWLVGDEDEDGRVIRRYAAQHDLNDRVEIYGHCPDTQLWALYQQADIFALPTQYESFGIVFLEAMAHGLPVVTYGVGPVPQVLTQGAVVVPLNDEQSFCDALLGLVTDTHRRLRLSAEAKALAERSYSWPVVTMRFHDVYKRLATSDPIVRRP